MEIAHAPISVLVGQDWAGLRNDRFQGVLTADFLKKRPANTGIG